MFTLKYTANRQRLDLPEYKLSESKEAIKSTFIDRNRVDTVKPMVTLDESDNKQVTVMNSKG